MKQIKLKLMAIWDIIINKRFYLITFTDEGKVNWRTVYGVPDECAEIDEDQIENLKHH